MIFYLTFRKKQLFQGTYLLHTGKIYWFQSGFQQYTFSVSSIFFEIYTKLVYNNSSFGSLGQNLIIVPISKYEEKYLTLKHHMSDIKTFGYKLQILRLRVLSPLLKESMAQIWPDKEVRWTQWKKTQPAFITKRVIKCTRKNL